MNFKQYLLENEENPFAVLQGKLIGLQPWKTFIPIHENTIQAPEGLDVDKIPYRGFIEVKKVLIEIVDSTKLNAYKTYNKGQMESDDDFSLSHIGAYIVKEIIGIPNIDFTMREKFLFPDDSELKKAKNFKNYISGVIYNNTIEEAIKNINYLHDLVVKNPKVDLADYDDNKLDDDEFRMIELLIGRINHEITENEMYVDAELKRLHPNGL